MIANDNLWVAAVLFIILMIAVLPIAGIWMFGATFGQRCEHWGWEDSTPEFHYCVQALHKGEDPFQYVQQKTRDLE